MEDDPVHHTLRKVATKLEELGIPYAIAGGMALGAHRFVRATVDVDVLVTAGGLKEIHANLDGKGFVLPFPGRLNPFAREKFEELWRALADSPQPEQ